MTEIIILILCAIVGNFLIFMFIKFYLIKKYIKPFLEYNDISHGKIIFLFFKTGFFDKRKITILFSQNGNMNNTFYFNILDIGNSNVIFTVKADFFFLFVKNVQIKNEKEFIILK